MPASPKSKATAGQVTGPLRASASFSFRRRWRPPFPMARASAPRASPRREVGAGEAPRHGVAAKANGQPLLSSQGSDDIELGDAAAARPALALAGLADNRRAIALAHEAAGHPPGDSLRSPRMGD